LNTAGRFGCYSAGPKGRFYVSPGQRPGIVKPGDQAPNGAALHSHYSQQPLTCRLGPPRWGWHQLVMPPRASPWADIGLAPWAGDPVFRNLQTSEMRRAALGAPEVISQVRLHHISVSPPVRLPLRNFGSWAVRLRNGLLRSPKRVLNFRRSRCSSGGNTDARALALWPIELL
jgi:hypothetical protein